jgi:tight adherence protein C
MTGLLLIFAWLLLAWGALRIALYVRRSDRMRKRLFVADAGAEALLPPGSDEPRLLGRWLFLAGYRTRSAANVFVFVTAVLFCVGVGAAYLIQKSGMIDRALAAIGAFPGGALDIIAPLIYAAPWIVFGFLAATPYLVVRAARKQRVGAIEKDMPLTLEILSTLAETGLSFDSALDRLLESQSVSRPLSQELRTFRDETRAGRPRVQSFRRLAKRVHVTPVSTFVSALVQAEQTGAGVATVLREQADDLRKRRRERALEEATALPVKRLVPLFICFLPGIFVWSLGPSFFQLIRFMDVFTRNRRLP